MIQVEMEQDVYMDIIKREGNNMRSKTIKILMNNPKLKGLGAGEFSKEVKNMMVVQNG